MLTDAFVWGGILVMWLCAVAIAVHALHIKKTIESMTDELVLIRKKLESVSSDLGHAEWMVDWTYDHMFEDEAKKKAAEEAKKHDPELLTDDIHLITRNEFEFDTSVTNSTRLLRYYKDSGKLFYLDYEVKDAYEVVGPALGYFGYNREDENAIYVRNHRYKTDFEIHREEGMGPEPMYNVVDTESYNIIHVGSHYEVCINGNFYCSADTISEACKEVEEYFENEMKKENGNESEGSESAGESNEERVEETTCV